MSELTEPNSLEMVAVMELRNKPSYRLTVSIEDELNTNEYFSNLMDEWMFYAQKQLFKIQTYMVWPYSTLLLFLNYY